MNNWCIGFYTSVGFWLDATNMRVSEYYPDTSVVRVNSMHSVSLRSDSVYHNLAHLISESNLSVMIMNEHKTEFE